MNKLTCRGCGKELENCTCNVLTTEKKEQTKKLKLIEIYDPCIPCEKEHNGECFDIECHSNARYNAKVLGANLQLESDQLVVDNLQTINESHRRLNGELRERIRELEGTAITKDEAERLIELITSSYVENYNEDFRKVAKSGFAKLQKIIDKRG